MKIVLTVVLLLASTACSSDAAMKPIEVQVHGTGEQCAVGDTSVPCQSVVTYLRETLHTPTDAAILVKGDKTANGSIVGRVSAALTTAGFRNVSAVGFLTVPPIK